MFDEGGTIANVTFSQNAGGSGGAGGAGGNGPSSSTGGAGGDGAGNAGVAQSAASESLLLVHDTIAGNQPGLGGAGGASGGGNSALQGAAGNAGANGVGVEQFTANITLQNSIVANAGDNCTGTITDGGHNVTFPGGDSDCASGSHADPLLGALGDHTGPVQTMLIGTASPARDLVPSSGAQCQAKDARGVTRPVGTACDAGAVELWPVSAIATIAATGVTTSGATLNGTVTPGLQTLVHFEYGMDTSYGTLARHPGEPAERDHVRRRRAGTEHDLPLSPGRRGDRWRRGGRRHDVHHGGAGGGAASGRHQPASGQDVRRRDDQGRQGHGHQEPRRRSP